MSLALPHSASEKRLSPETVRMAISGESPSTSANTPTRWWPQVGAFTILFRDSEDAYLPVPPGLERPHVVDVYLLLLYFRNLGGEYGLQ